MVRKHKYISTNDKKNPLFKELIDIKLELAVIKNELKYHRKLIFLILASIIAMFLRLFFI